MLWALHPMGGTATLDQGMNNPLAQYSCRCGARVKYRASPPSFGHLAVGETCSALNALQFIGDRIQRKRAVCLPSGQIDLCDYFPGGTGLRQLYRLRLPPLEPEQGLEHLSRWQLPRYLMFAKGGQIDVQRALCEKDRLVLHVGAHQLALTAAELPMEQAMHYQGVFTLDIHAIDQQVLCQWPGRNVIDIVDEVVIRGLPGYRTHHQRLATYARRIEDCWQQEQGQRDKE